MLTAICSPIQQHPDLQVLEIACGLPCVDGGLVYDIYES